LYGLMKKRKDKTMELIGICQNKCWCEFCSQPIEKEEKFICMFKQARKGTARINICRRCLIKMFLELNAGKKEIDVIKKEVILDKL